MFHKDLEDQIYTLERKVKDLECNLGKFWYGNGFNQSIPLNMAVYYLCQYLKIKFSYSPESIIVEKNDDK